MLKQTFKKKKASALVEFIIIIPMIWFAAWACMFIIFYSMAQNTVHQAANEGARILTQELRGNTGNIPKDDEELRNLLLDKIKTSASSFNYVLLFHDEKGTAKTPELYIEPTQNCKDIIKDKARVICVYTEKGTKSGISQQQIVVMIKSKFQAIGNIIPGLADNTYASGKGTSEKEFSGRFNYWN